MIIEIRRAGFINKGAELMLISVLKKIREKYPSAIITMEPTAATGPRPINKLMKYNIYPKASYRLFNIQLGRTFTFLPKSFLNNFGIILEKDIDIVLDVAGFAYSDQWKLEYTKELYSYMCRSKRKKTGIILLPQAFGPFDSEKIKAYMSVIIDNSLLIYARDKTSYTHLKKITKKESKIQISPDFTNLINGKAPSNFDTETHKVCLIPNFRMIDKTNKENSDTYTSFMVKTVKYLISKEAKPFLLIHEGDNDLMLAKKISKESGGIPIIKETDPLVIKGIIGLSEASIGSRFHGLVSALDQGVPSLATSWSHKYQRLFDDYGFSEGIISSTAEDSEIHKKIDLIINTNSHSMIRERLLNRSIRMKSLTENMWQSVFCQIDNKNESH